jgi:hypothetical protein
MFRPITPAPMFAIPSSMISLLGFTSPPLLPCGCRQASSLTTHSCSCIPPSPSGCSSLWLGPAAYPSTEIEISNLSMLTTTYTRA